MHPAFNERMFGGASDFDSFDFKKLRIRLRKGSETCDPLQAHPNQILFEYWFLSMNG